MGRGRRTIKAAGALALLTILTALLPGPANAAVGVIQVGDNSFNPTDLNVTVGDTVRWTFVNAADHTVTLVPIGGGTPVVDESVGPGQPDLDYIASTAGRYTLLCQIHSPMRGRVDVLAATEPLDPVTAAGLTPAAPGPGGTYGGPVTLALAATDNSGVATTDLRINGGGFEPYSGPRTFSTEGARTIEYRSTDISEPANVEDLKTVTFTVDDTTPPATTHSLSGSEGAAGSFTGPVTVTLAAADPGGLGVDRTEYRIDGGGFVPYGAPFMVGGPGAHAVEYRSLDRGQNTEPTRSASFSIEATAPPPTPSLSLAAPPGKLKAKALNRGVEIAVACSGVPDASLTLTPNAAGARKLELKPGTPLASATVACGAGETTGELRTGRKAAKAVADLAGSIRAALVLRSGDLRDSARVTIKGSGRS